MASATGNLLDSIKQKITPESRFFWNEPTEENIFDYLYQTAVASMRFRGENADKSWNLQWTFIFILMHMVYTISLLPFVFSILTYDIKHDAADVCAEGTMLIIYFVISFKCYVICKYHRSQDLLSKLMKQDYMVSKTLPIEEVNILSKYAKKRRFVTKFWVTIAYGTFSVTIVTYVLLTLYHTVTNKFELVPFLKLSYPNKIQDMYGLETYKKIVFLLQVYFSTFTLQIYTYVVPLGPMCTIHASGQIELLKYRIMELFPENYIMNSEERMRRLKNIAIRLQEIYDFVDEIKKSLKLLYEMTFRGTSLIIPVLLLAIRESYGKGDLRAEMMGITLGALVISSLPCYYGDMLIEKSDDFREAVYSCGWERVWDKKSRSVLIILMIRTTRSIAIGSIFRLVNLESLAEVFKQADTLLNLLRVALDKR